MILRSKITWAQYQKGISMKRWYGGLKTAVFIADDEALLSDIVNDNEYYLQYVSNDTLSNVTGYLEAKLGTSAGAYYNVDKKVTLSERAVNWGGWIYNTGHAISWSAMQVLGWYIGTHVGPLAPSPRQICESTSGACETWSAELTGFTYSIEDQLYDGAVGNWPDYHSYSVIGQKTIFGKVLDFCFSDRSNGGN